MLYKNVRKATYTLCLRVCVLTIKNMSHFVQAFLCNGRFYRYSQLHNNVQTRMENPQLFLLNSGMTYTNGTTKIDTKKEDVCSTMLNNAPVGITRRKTELLKHTSTYEYIIIR